MHTLVHTHIRTVATLTISSTVHSHTVINVNLTEYSSEARGTHTLKAVDHISARTPHCHYSSLLNSGQSHYSQGQ